MISNYKGKTVTLQRDAQPIDEGYDETLDQVVIFHKDGSKDLVLRDEVKQGPAFPMKQSAPPTPKKLPSHAAIKHAKTRARRRGTHKRH
jgi:hypothetical protein